MLCSDDCSCVNTLVALRNSIGVIRSEYDHRVGWKTVACQELRKDMLVVQYTGKVRALTVVGALRVSLTFLTG